MKIYFTVNKHVNNTTKENHKLFPMISRLGDSNIFDRWEHEIKVYYAVEIYKRKMLKNAIVCAQIGNQKNLPVYVSKNILSYIFVSKKQYKRWMLILYIVPHPTYFGFNDYILALMATYQDKMERKSSPPEIIS